MLSRTPSSPRRYSSCTRSHAVLPCRISCGAQISAPYSNRSDANQEAGRDLEERTHLQDGGKNMAHILRPQQPVRVGSGSSRSLVAAGARLRPVKSSQLQRREKGPGMTRIPVI